MIEHLVLRLDAPLMSFGGAAIDANGVIDDHPGVSMLTGLLGNALGWSHGDTVRLGALQARLRVASRLDRPGERTVDFHTVDLGDPHLDGTGWTTSGAREDRRGGTASSGTHIRYRHFLADATATVVLRLDPADEAPTLDEVEAALRRPARPLFLGRKTCLPASPLLVGRVVAKSLTDALALAPWHPRGVTEASAQWPDDDGPEGTLLRWTHDLRDWRANVHAGARLVRVGRVRRPEATDG